MTQLNDNFPTDLQWQVTTTTVWCPSTERRVTLIVKNDWTSYCCLYEENKESDIQGKPPRCEGVGCSLVIDYRNCLIDEERVAN